MSRTRRAILPWAAHRVFSKPGPRNEFAHGYDKLSRRPKTKNKSYFDRLTPQAVAELRASCVLRDHREQLEDFHAEQLEARQQRTCQRAEKYHDTIIKDPEDYDGIEVCGVSVVDFGDGTTACEPVFSAAETPDFYSVYACLKLGGVDCIGDLPTRSEALAYAKEISELYGWPVNDFTWFMPLRDLPAVA